MKSIAAVFLLLILTFIGCVNEPENDEYVSPDIISGTVKNTAGLPLENAKVTLPTAPSYEGVFTNSAGVFQLEGFPPGKHNIKVELYGYEDYTAEVPKPYNGYSTVNPVLKSKTYNVPVEKPLSKGSVRINNRKLEIDPDGDGNYTPFFVKGVAYSPTPIGNRPITEEQENRSIQYLKDLHANTIRTYSGASKALMQRLAGEGIYTILGFWAGNSDLSLEENRDAVKNDFIRFVTDYKDTPGILFWNLGNEQNYVNGDNPYWYSLCQELAVVAYNIEGENFHPVCISNGNIYNIGNASKSADDASLKYIDAWASNIYEMNFTNSINTYRTKSDKPIVFTEFGIDALDNRTKTEYELVQAEHDSLNWVQILNNSDVVLGGTVFEFTDEWWKAGDPYSKDFGGYQTGAHPDGYSNEEWWGLIRVNQDANGDGMDDWTPRRAYYMFQQMWQ